MASVWTPDELFNHLSTAVHNFSSDTHKVALTNVAPTKAGTAVLGDITQITSAGGYAATAITLTWAETGSGTGVWQLGDTDSDCSFTPSGAAFDECRYAVLYAEKTVGSVTNPVIAVLDYGSAFTLGDGQTLTVDAGANGWLRMTNPSWA